MSLAVCLFVPRPFRPFVVTVAGKRGWVKGQVAGSLQISPDTLEHFSRHFHENTESHHFNPHNLENEKQKIILNCLFLINLINL